MEFLYKLYDNEYFGIALFIVIAILIFLFLLILFFGKKDEKKRKLEETKRLELESTNAFKETNENVESLEIPEIAQPTLNVEQENTVPLESNNEVVLNTPTLDVSSVNSDNINNTVSSDNNLLNSQTADLDSIDLQSNILNNNEVIDLPKTNDLATTENVNENSLDIDNLFQTNIELPKENATVDNHQLNIEMPEIKEEKHDALKVEAPFSSVYINKQEDINKVELPKENIQPLGFELPKMAESNNVTHEPDDLKEEKEVKAEPEISKISDFDSLFGDIENETYNINK